MEALPATGPLEHLNQGCASCNAKKHTPIALRNFRLHFNQICPGASCSRWICHTCVIRENTSNFKCKQHATVSMPPAPKPASTRARKEKNLSGASSVNDFERGDGYDCDAGDAGGSSMEQHYMDGMNVIEETQGGGGNKLHVPSAPTRPKPKFVSSSPLCPDGMAGDCSQCSWSKSDHFVSTILITKDNKQGVYYSVRNTNASTRRILYRFNGGWVCSDTSCQSLNKAAESTVGAADDCVYHTCIHVRQALHDILIEKVGTPVRIMDLGDLDVEAVRQHGANPDSSTDRSGRLMEQQKMANIANVPLVVELCRDKNGDVNYAVFARNSERGSIPYCAVISKPKEGLGAPELLCKASSGSPCNFKRQRGASTSGCEHLHAVRVVLCIYDDGTPAAATAADPSPDNSGGCDGAGEESSDENGTRESEDTPSTDLLQKARIRLAIDFHTSATRFPVATRKHRWEFRTSYNDPSLWPLKELRLDITVCPCCEQPLELMRGTKKSGTQVLLTTDSAAYSVDIEEKWCAHCKIPFRPQGDLHSKPVFNFRGKMLIDLRLLESLRLQRCKGFPVGKICESYIAGLDYDPILRQKYSAFVVKADDLANALYAYEGNVEHPHLHVSFLYGLYPLVLTADGFMKSVIDLSAADKIYEDRGECLLDSDEQALEFQRTLCSAQVSPGGARIRMNEPLSHFAPVLNPLLRRHTRHLQSGRQGAAPTKKEVGNLAALQRMLWEWRQADVEKYRGLSDDQILNMTPAAALDQFKPCLRSLHKATFGTQGSALNRTNILSKLKEFLEEMTLESLQESEGEPLGDKDVDGGSGSGSGSLTQKKLLICDKNFDRVNLGNSDTTAGVFSFYSPDGVRYCSQILRENEGVRDVGDIYMQMSSPPILIVYDLMCRVVSSLRTASGEKSQLFTKLLCNDGAIPEDGNIPALNQVQGPLQAAARLNFRQSIQEVSVGGEVDSSGGSCAPTETAFPTSAPIETAIPTSAPTVTATPTSAPTASTEPTLTAGVEAPHRQTRPASIGDVKDLYDLFALLRPTPLPIFSPTHIWESTLEYFISKYFEEAGQIERFGRMVNSICSIRSTGKLVLVRLEEVLLLIHQHASCLSCHIQNLVSNTLLAIGSGLPLVTFSFTLPLITPVIGGSPEDRLEQESRMLVSAYVQQKEMYLKHGLFGDNKEAEKIIWESLQRGGGAVLYNRDPHMLVSMCKDISFIKGGPAFTPSIPLHQPVEMDRSKYQYAAHPSTGTHERYAGIDGLHLVNHKNPACQQYNAQKILQLGGVSILTHEQENRHQKSFVPVLTQQSPALFFQTHFLFDAFRDNEKNMEYLFRLLRNSKGHEHPFAKCLDDFQHTGRCFCNNPMFASLDKYFIATLKKCDVSAHPTVASAESSGDSQHKEPESSEENSSTITNIQTQHPTTDGNSTSNTASPSQVGQSISVLGYPILLPVDKTPHPTQMSVMESVLQAITIGENALVQSPTGTGKTLAILAAAISHQKAEKLREGGRFSTIIYLSRTQIQLKQVSRELKSLYNLVSQESRETPSKMSMTHLSSRSRSCINDVAKNSDRGVDEACRTLVHENNCSYRHRVAPLTASLPEVWDIEDLIDVGQRQGGCPYYAAMKQVNLSEIILAPYNYMIGGIRLPELDQHLDNAVVIFDEAHNLETAAKQTQEIAQDAVTSGNHAHIQTVQHVVTVLQVLCANAEDGSRNSQHFWMGLVDAPF